eukprot:GHVR01061232.1.p1 GENE.GHVR01061232.1~~GHVR01061232.1.p1  ORF type:complete len:128 (-),score=19.96 GHVR01061232.1:287-670(-)
MCDLGEEDLAFLDRNAKATRPAAVERLVSDLKNAAAYHMATESKDPTLMHKAFNSISWDDTRVQAALPSYLNSCGGTRARVDYAYSVLCPKPKDTKDPKQAMMSLWLKARLFSYDEHFPFQFNPYTR